MKKYIVAGAVVVAFGIYLLLTMQKSTYVASVAEGGNATNTTDVTNAADTPDSNVATSSGAGTSPAGMGSTYKDGSYKGSVANAYYGNLQVEAVIAGGKLVDVQYPVFPNASGHTQEVSTTDLPILKQEAIAAQDANVDIVSGATQTSQAFQQSLGVALAMAKN